MPQHWTSSIYRKHCSETFTLIHRRCLHRTLVMLLQWNHPHRIWRHLNGIGVYKALLCLYCHPALSRIQHLKILKVRRVCGGFASRVKTICLGSTEFHSHRLTQPPLSRRIFASDTVFDFQNAAVLRVCFLVGDVWKTMP